MVKTTQTYRLMFNVDRDAGLAGQLFFRGKCTGDSCDYWGPREEKERCPFIKI